MILEEAIKDYSNALEKDDALIKIDKKVKKIVISNHGQTYTIASCFEGIKIIKHDSRNKLMILPDERDSIIVS